MNRGSNLKAQARSQESRDWQRFVTNPFYILKENIAAAVSTSNLKIQSIRENEQRAPHETQRDGAARATLPPFIPCSS